MDDSQKHGDAPASASSNEAPLPSERIGPYRVLRLLGRGSIGTVYLADRDEGAAIYAVKTLSPEPDDSTDAPAPRYGPERLNLTHVNVVKTELLPNSEDLIRLLMPYVGDEVGPMRLDRFLKERGGSLPPATVGRLIRQLLQGLGHGHRQGLMHGNLKPSNVLLDLSTGSPIAKIADLGIVDLFGEAAFRQRVYASVSRSVSFGGAALTDVESESDFDPSSTDLPEGEAELGSSGAALLDSWAYMAPEQRMPEGRSDQRADIHAAGLLAHLMLTGRLPDSLGDAPVRLRPRLSAWETWINRCLMSEPNERFQSARAAHDALPEQAKSNTGGRTATMLMLVAVVVLLVISAVVAVPLLSSLWYGDEEAPVLNDEPAPQPQSDPAQLPAAEPEIDVDDE